MIDCGGFSTFGKRNSLKLSLNYNTIRWYRMVTTPFFGGQARTLAVALAGHPNSGKTTLFNALTGLRQKVANYPGVTVEKKNRPMQARGQARQRPLDQHH